MSTSVIVYTGSNSYNLTDGSLSWRIVDDGLAMAPIRRLEERGPLQHGVTDVGFRLDPRVFHLTLKTQGSTLAALYNNRAQLINIFKPMPSTPFSIRYVLDNGAIRQIDCNLNSEMKMDEKDREGFLQVCVLTFRAPDPCFYDPGQQNITWGNTVGSQLAVPLSVPLQISSNLAINQTYPLNYQGTFPAYPVITLKGPIKDPVIWNFTTGEKLSFAGYSVPGGFTYTIDTRYGYKTVYDQNGVNRLGQLSSDSNLATFHLEVDPLAPSGINGILIEGSGLNSNSSATLSYYTRYLGM